MNAQPKLTPMMAQYWDIKKQYQDCLLFFRMGDFYEMFFDDAITAAKALDIALTKRGKTEDQDIPMCGVPVHAVEAYTARLIKLGFRIAICEQTESPEAARKRGTKSIVTREVIRVLTPGTITEETLLEAQEHTYIAAFDIETPSQASLAWLDVSTGDFFVETINPNLLEHSFIRINPKEILCNETARNDPHILARIPEELKEVLVFVPQSYFDSRVAALKLKTAYHLNNLESFGQFCTTDITALGAILEYVMRLNKVQVTHLRPIKHVKQEAYLHIDSATRKNLELLRTLDGHKKGSFFDSINKTVTPSGARLLEEWVSMPLHDYDKIMERLLCVDFFYENTQLFEVLSNNLKSAPDMERALSRLSFQRGNPRDLGILIDTLEAAHNIYEILSPLALPPLLQQALNVVPQTQPILKRLVQALNDELPHQLKEGGFIRPFYHETLDHLRVLRDEGKQMILQFEQNYKTLSQIPSLKIKHNQVFGYFVEITPTHKKRMEEDALKAIFIHRQTLANSIRFTTEELFTWEEKLNKAAGEAQALEEQIFQELVDMCLEHSEILSKTAMALSFVDVLSGFARLAREAHYVKPELDTTENLEIIHGRHIVVEQSLNKAHKKGFQANDCLLQSNKNNIALITGPNMAGKSTYLRQVALIVLMAQMGAYVPAERAKIGLIDRLYCRVGASDNLAKGQSTFMVEMVETAAILNQATHRSLIILDEIGRGTATFDGLSIAWASLEYIHNVLKCRALFATHYHELTNLQKSLPYLSCYTLAIEEHDNELLFLHKVIPGSMNRSFGIHVAELAGLPQAVIIRAKQVLKKLESSERQQPALLKIQPDLFEYANEVTRPVATTPPEEISPLEVDLANLNLDMLTPKEALNWLYEKKQCLKKIVSN